MQKKKVVEKGDWLIGLTSSAASPPTMPVPGRRSRSRPTVVAFTFRPDDEKKRGRRGNAKERAHRGGKRV